MGFFDNKTVTLFNRSFNAETEEETYYPTLLEGVDLVETKGANVSKSGMDSADAVPFAAPFEFEHGSNGCLSALRITYQFETVSLFLNSLLLQILAGGLDHIGTSCSGQPGMQVRMLPVRSLTGTIT